MSRIRDYLNFSFSFSGIGYIAMWPLSTPDTQGHVFGAAFLCRDDSIALLDLVCRLPHPLLMPPSLHLLGLAASVYVAGRLVLRLLRAAAHRARPAREMAQLEARLSALTAQPARRGPPRPHPARRPRAHFGLRAQS